MSWFKRAWMLLLLLPTAALAAGAPPFINYQGVLRDASDRPLDATMSMTLRLFSAATVGDEILVDSHPAVTVSKGLFTVQIGGGTLADGSGPGTYGFLPFVFKDYTNVYLEVQVNGEVLSPRAQIVSAAYALNTRYVNGVEVASGGALNLYVSAATGDDNNSGLSSSAPKRTIQAAVDRIPAIIKGDVTVYIAPGTYAEAVLIADRSAPAGHRIRLVGDLANPSACVISGSGVRGEVLTVRNLPVVDLEGLSFDNAAGAEGPTGMGVQFWNSTGSIESCRMSNNANAGLSAWSSFVQIRNTQFSGNRFGVHASGASFVVLESVSVTGSTRFGISAEYGGVIWAAGALTVTGGAAEGCRAEAGGFINFDGLPVSIQGNNTGGSQCTARLHGIVVGYENAAIDSPACVEVLSGTCSPGRY